MLHIPLHCDWYSVQATKVIIICQSTKICLHIFRSVAVLQCCSSILSHQPTKEKFYIYIYIYINIGVNLTIVHSNFELQHCNTATDSVTQSVSFERVRQFLILTFQPRFLNRFSQATPLRFWQSQFFFVPLQCWK